MTAAATAYRLASDLAWREWDDAIVVYHDRSGETHCLGGVEGAAFLLLTEAPATFEALQAELIPSIEPPDTGDAVDLLRAAVDLLQSLQLVEALPAGARLTH